MKRLAGLTFLLIITVAPARAEAPAAKAITVPFELLKSKHMAVMVKLNGKGPYRLIFDTGAPTTVLNNRAARGSGVLPRDASKPILSLFGAMGQFPIKTMEIGDLRVADQNTVVMDHPLVEVMSRALGPIEGIVGFPFFARYAMTLDYQARQMTLVPNGFQPVDLVKKLEATLMGGPRQGPKMLVPAAQWGMIVDKDGRDEEAGVSVREVLPGSAAALAGLKAGDRLLVLDDRWTDSVADCYQAASHVLPGTAATVTIERAGKRMQLTVKPRAGL